MHSDSKKILLKDVARIIIGPELVQKKADTKLNDRCDRILDDADRHCGQTDIPTVAGLDQCFQALKCHS